MTKAMEKILSSNYMYLAFFAVAYLGWLFNITHVSVILLCFFVALILVFCDDPKGILVVILPVEFFTRGIQSNEDYYYYGVAIGIGLIGILYYLIKQVFIKKKKVVKGKMFWAFVCITIACMLGGSVYHFSIMPKISIFGICFAVYFVYFFCINFTTNLKDFLRNCFIAFAVFAIVQLITLHIQSGDFLNSFTYKSVIWVGGTHINTAALYLVMGMLSMYWLAYEKKKFDYLYCLGGIGFLLATYFTYGRIALFIGGIFTIICFIIIFIKSPNKVIFLVSFGVIVGGVAVFAILRWDRFLHLISEYIKIGFAGRGREVLWPWCIDRFMREPIFGIGFLTYNDPVPTIELNNVVIAHNTFLQFLTSTGIVGIILVSYFYVMKYRVLLNDFKGFDLFIFLISLAIAAVGMVDQSVTMDIFLVIWILFIALAETQSKENMKENIAVEGVEQEEKEKKQSRQQKKDDVVGSKTTTRKKQKNNST